MFTFSISWGVAVRSVWPDVIHCLAKMTYWPRPKSSSQLQTRSVPHWANGALWSLRTTIKEKRFVLAYHYRQPAIHNGLRCKINWINKYIKVCQLCHYRLKSESLNPRIIIIIMWGDYIQKKTWAQRYPTSYYQRISSISFLPCHWFLFSRIGKFAMRHLFFNINKTGISLRNIQMSYPHNMTKIEAQKLQYDI